MRSVSPLSFSSRTKASCCSAKNVYSFFCVLSWDDTLLMLGYESVVTSSMELVAGCCRGPFMLPANRALTFSFVLQSDKACILLTSIAVLTLLHSPSLPYQVGPFWIFCMYPKEFEMRMRACPGQINAVSINNPVDSS